MVTLSRHVSNVEEASVSAAERRFLILIVLGLTIALDAISTFIGLRVDGRHGAAACGFFAILGDAVVFVVWGLAVCVLPDRQFNRLRNYWHRRWCRLVRIPYIPLPEKPATKHPTDIDAGGHAQLVPGDVVVVRKLTDESFNHLVTQHGLRPPESR